MLKAVLDTDPSILAVRSIKRLLNGVLVEHGILPSEPAYFDALVTSLTPEEVWLPSTKTINFFDSCASRIARQPVHYEDLAAELDGNGVTTCLLPICIAEQWPFVLRDQDLGGQENVGEWIMRLLVLLKYAGENPDVLTQLSNQIVNATNDAALKQKFRKAYERRPERTVYLQKPEEAGREASVPPSTTTDEVPAIKTVLQTAFEQRPRKVETIEGLERLYEEDLEELIADRRLARLCRSLSSPAEETRRQALVTLQRLTKQIEVHTSIVKRLQATNRVCSCLITLKRALCSF